MRIEGSRRTMGHRRASLVDWVRVVFGVIALLAVAGPAMGQSQTTFSGQATVVRATAPIVGNVVLADTGPIAPGGGAASATLLEASVPGLLSAEVLHASVVSGGDQSNAEASVASLDLTVSGNAISADFLQAQAQAQCRDGRASVSGSSQIAVLSINGQTIAVSGEANQTVALPVGYVIVNEQVVSADASGKCASITVNALHVVVPGIADVVIASAHADICCAAQPPCDKDFVTSGGWITGTPTGSRGALAVTGGLKKNGFWGHLTFIDHGARLKVKGTGVTSYTPVGPTSRRITGTCEINGVAGTYDVTVSDNGEPGRDDTFSITLSNGYTAAGNLIGGNVQLHICK